MSLTRMGALRTLLLSNSTIASEVTTNSVSRIAPVPLDPETIYPSITLQEIAGKMLESMDGYSGIGRTRFQITCWDKSYLSAVNLRELVKLTLSCYKGAAGSFIILGSNHAGDREFYDGKLGAHQAICDFYIWWDINLE